jgi:hypothetical protein
LIYKEVLRNYLFKLLFVCLSASIVFAYSGGTGIETDPYQIGSVSDWQQLMNTSTDWDKHFVLIADVNLQGVTISPINFSGVFEGNNYVIRNVVVNRTADFVGLFSRLYNTGQIRNLGVENISVTGRSYVGGLVGSSDGFIFRCYVKGMIVGEYDYVGGLAGRSTGPISDCFAAGTVTGGYNFVGGLVGSNWGPDTISNCYAVGTVNGNSYVGGLAGENRGTVIVCYAAGIVTGSGNYIGGLVGNNISAINNCYAIEKVYGDSSVSNYVGGLTGRNSGNITDCRTTGIAVGYENIGGLVGYNSNTIGNCYATGFVHGGSVVGGLLGYNTSTITNCYSTGPIVSSGTKGGLIASNVGGTVTACFWDTQTSGVTDSSGGTGKTTVEMQDIDTFLNAGWDFVGESANGTADIWQIRSDIADYPKLLWQFPVADFNYDMIVNLTDFAIMANSWLLSAGQAGYNETCDIYDDDTINLDDFSVFCDNWLSSSPTPYTGGRGTESDPYKIATKQDLLCFSADTENYNKHFVLTADINLAGIVFESAVIAPFVPYSTVPGTFTQTVPFNGSFNGYGRIISHLDINMPGNDGAGLFGMVDSCGQIHNLGLEDVNIIGGNYVGGVAGRNYGEITSCYITGVVKGTEVYVHNSVGGLAGSNYGTITACYAAADVTGMGDSVGGLVGWNYRKIVYNPYNVYIGTIVECYAAGEVMGRNRVGGLVGHNNGGSVANSYAKGKVAGSVNYIGGLVGENSTDTVSGIVSKCYAIGQVIGSGIYTGGLIGRRSGGSITDSFWDVNTTGWTTSAGGTGKTTAEMQDIDTFLNAGWDFTTSVWEICDGTNYPELSWQ